MDTTSASLVGNRPAISDDPAALTDVPLERLEAELCTWSANLAAAEYRWFALLAEFDRRLGWQQWECHSCVAWMAWQLGLDARTAREKLRVAHALAISPLIAEQMRQGRLSYSKVRAITRITEPANEASLVEIALAGTTAHVERVVAGYRRALPPDNDASDEVQWAKRCLRVRHDDDDRTITITITLPAATAMEVISAVDHLTPRAGTEPDGERASLAARRADAVVAGRSYMSARSVTTTETRGPAANAVVSADMNRSRSAASTSVQHSSNWSTINTNPAADWRATAAMQSAGSAWSSGVVDTTDNAACKAASGAAPGVMVVTSNSSRSRRRGIKPAWTSELFPQPDGPTTATSGERSTAAHRSAIIAVRPKYSPASTSANERSPRYGFTPARARALS